MVARKYADARDKPDTLEAIFQMAEQCSKKMLEADSFDYSNTFRVPSTISENRIITKVKRTSTRSHGKTRIKSHGTKITSPSMVIRSPSPKMLASQLLKT